MSSIVVSYYAMLILCPGRSDIFSVLREMDLQERGGREERLEYWDRGKAAVKI